jgi:electron transport complex protein RnfC
MATRTHFPAGIALESHKRADWVLPVKHLRLPSRVMLSLDPGTGATAEPVVSVGDVLARGALVGRASSPFSANVHASIAGTVVAVEERESATPAGVSLCVIIARTETETVAPLQLPAPDISTLDAAGLQQALRDAGFAGLGGAGFPTATKLASARERSVHTLLLNGAECEPWISCDDALMQTAAADVIAGARVLRDACGATACVIAIEDDKPAAIAAVTSAIERARDPAVTLVVVPAVYPRGAERQLIAAVTGVETPSGGLPVDAGIVCQNVATAAAIARWAQHGEPLLSRIVTVTGSGVVSPCNVHAPLGTPLAELVAAAGGYQGTPLRLIAGGNMTGLALPSDEIGLGKATNCIFVATHADLAPRLDAFERPCIRCGDCADVCPPGLLPQQLHRAALADEHATLRELGAFDCIDCGLCDYVCPSQIPLAHRFRLARGRLREADAAARKAEAARERHELRQRRLRDEAAEQQRAFEAVRAQAVTAERGGGTSGDTASDRPGATH